MHAQAWAIWRVHLADYEEALRLKPDYADAYYNRAIALQDRAIWMERWEDSTRPSGSTPIMQMPITSRSDNHQRNKEMPMRL